VILVYCDCGFCCGRGNSVAVVLFELCYGVACVCFVCLRLTCYLCFSGGLDVV